MDEGKRTRVGRFIANYPLDHLPQLFNLLEGDTTLIGPRPEMADRVNLSDPSWQRILTVKPGLGCFAVLELATRYNTSSQEVKNRVEIQYVDARSAALDLRIFVRAIRALIVSRGNVKLRGKPNVQDEKDR